MRMTELAKRTLLCEHRLEIKYQKLADRRAKSTITEDDLVLKPLTLAQIKRELEPQPLGKITNESLVNM